MKKCILNLKVIIYQINIYMKSFNIIIDIEYSIKNLLR